MPALSITDPVLRTPLPLENRTPRTMVVSKNTTVSVTVMRVRTLPARLPNRLSPMPLPKAMPRPWSLDFCARITTTSRNAATTSTIKSRLMTMDMFWLLTI